jgi:hypothetical protein
MGFLVEDGAGRTNANALVSADACTAYHQLRGNSAWIGTSAQMEAAIVRATDYLCGAYRWKGVRTTSSQALCWPRIGVIDADGRAVGPEEIPVATVAACCELALEALGGELGRSLERGGLVSREKVDCIEVEYAPGAPAAPSYPRAESLLRRAGLLEPRALGRLARS